MGLFGDKDKDKLSKAKETGRPVGGPGMPNHPGNRPGAGHPGNPMGGFGHQAGGRPMNGPGMQGYPGNRPGTGNPGRPGSSNMDRHYPPNQKAMEQKSSGGGILDALSSLFDDDDDQKYPNHQNHSYHNNGGYGRDNQNYGRQNYGQQGYGNYGHPTPPPQQHGGMFGGSGKPFGAMPSTPADRYRQQNGGSILGTIVEGVVASAVASKVQEQQLEAAQKAQEAEALAERNADYSMAEGYPSFCPGCGAPTTGKRFCEYCGTKVY